MTTHIRSLNPDISIFSTQFNRFGIIPIGARATAIKLSNSDIIVVSPIPHNEEIKRHLQGLGKVAYLVAPDREHHIYLEQWSKLYPDAKIIGPKSLPSLDPNLKFHKVFGRDDHEAGFEKEVKAQYFPGHVNEEIALLHIKSKVLVEADLMFNLPAYEQYPSHPRGSHAGLLASLLSPMNFLKADSTSHKFFNYYLASKNRGEMIRSLDAMRDWEFETIVPCHGEVISKDAKGVWYDSFSWLFAKKEH